MATTSGTPHTRKSKSRRSSKQKLETPWYSSLLPAFLSHVCDLSGSLSCDDQSQTMGQKPAPFLYNDDEDLMTRLPIRLPSPRREDANTPEELFLWEVLDEMNELRCNPRRYADKRVPTSTTLVTRRRKLRPLMARFKDKEFTPPERDETQPSTWRGPTREPPEKRYQPPPVLTHEGAEALHEALELLQSTPPARACRRFVSRVMFRRLERCDARPEWIAERLSRYGQWYEAAAEMLTFRSLAESARFLALLDRRDRGMHCSRSATVPKHATNATCGISVAPHKALECIVVITAAVGYGPRPLPQPARVVTAEEDSEDEDAAPRRKSVSSSRERKLGVAFEAVLYSVPLPHVHDRVLTALRDGAVHIFLDYAPPENGRADCCFVDNLNS
ncbi:hypothetical protein CTAYLR_000396 [Chrysophaeum taylorii]|uniref:Uncharacterized protein n=1 Tax=Chrysophaeum taylorii TaxID=2483200 RepID=A0AAD7XMX3_9STRA|nr:hypothetical protein CTAYLR_000396 [Chrysophaeum taylorii]